MATSFPISQRTVQPGPNTIVSPNIPATAVGYVLLIQQVSWPHAGDVAVTVSLEASYNGGTEWQPLTSDTITDEATPATKGIVANAFKVIASLDPEVGGVARNLRFSYNFQKALTVSGSITAL